MPLTRVTPLDGDTILPLADAKAHLRVTHNDEDALIGQLRDAAIGHVERVSGVALAEGDWLWSARRFPPRVDLPMGPVSAVGDATYLDDSGVEQTYADARLVGSSAFPAVNGSWPTAYDYAAVEFTAGLASPDEAPELIAAAKLLLGHLYENREAVNVGNIATELPLGVQALIDTYRAVLV
jgi:uncharacterized phiE125 gp8 family phage protein